MILRTKYLACILVVWCIVLTGCVQDTGKYCAEKYPGTVYNPKTNECDHVETQPVTAATSPVSLVQAPVTPAAKPGRTFSDPNPVFLSKLNPRIKEIDSEESQLVSASDTPGDTVTMQDWAEKLSDTCEAAGNELGYLPVSTDFDGVKTEYVSYFEDEKSFADNYLTAIEYENTNQYSLAKKYYIAGKEFRLEAYDHRQAAQENLETYNRNNGTEIPGS